MTTIRIQVAPRVAPDNPRGARVAAAVVIALWRLLDGFGRQTHSQAKTRAREAQDVRELALTHQAGDPRFAADLFAAADRHEQLHGVN